MQQSPTHFVHLEQAQARLERLLRDHQAEDRFAPATVVVPTPYAGLYLRRAFGRSGLVNVRFIPLARLAELLGAPSLADAGRSPLKPAIESAAVRRAAGEAEGELEPFRTHPSFHSSLRKTFRDLRPAAPDALSRLERLGGVSGETVRLYTHFRDRIKAYYDREALAEAAAEAVRTGRAGAALDSLGRVIAYLPRTLTPAEQRLFDALRDAQNCETILAATGDPEADTVLPKTAAQPPTSSRPTPPQTQLLVASDTGEEVRSIIRSVADAVHAGAPFHRIAILYWQREPYAALIAEQLTAAGIPIAGPSTETLAATPVGRMLTGIVDLAGDDLPREEVMRWLTSCPIKAASPRYSPSRWDAVSRDAGVVAGIEQWRDRLANYARSRQRTAASQDEERSAGEENELAQSAAEAWALRSFVLKLHETLNRAGECLAWAALVDWAEELIEHYLDKDSLPPVEQDNLDTLKTALQELAILDTVEESADLNAFRTALDEALNRAAARAGALGEGLFVGSVRLAAGMRFDNVYLAGMVEGLVPPQLSDDPLVPHSERERVGLPFRSTAAERYDYLAAAATGRTRVLTYARGNNIAQREQHPSRWFLEEATRLYGSSVYPTMLSNARDLAQLREQPWFEEVVSAQHGINTVAASQPADIHDYDLHRLSQWQQLGNPIGAHHLASSEPVLSHALEMQRARIAAPLTIWDGDLSSAEETDGRIGPSNPELFSPTRLQTWATCPFRYFLANELGIAAPEQPEELATISALEKGSLLHTILERFIRDAQQQSAIPAPDESWSEDQRRRLLQIAAEEFRNAEQRGVTGKPLLWELARNEMLSDLDRFLKEDAKLRKKHGVSPHAVESSFGFARNEDETPPPSVEWSSARTGTLRFRGFIDRIDLSPSGDTALVLDYKTGGTSSYANMNKDPLQRGKLLQLPVYGLAAQQLLGDGVDVRVAYWFVTEKGKFATRPSNPKTLEEMLDAFSDVVGAITDGIGARLFPANPGRDGSNCRYCDFKNLCPTRREWHWRRKRNDPRLSAYVAMADEEASR
ncbi:MAG: PD-(D/E)XK nuclease family protein [Caldilineaceae bacterium]|nr:PD-(D/E)XK nuclease family protein [Caldilineaceae bacterium]MDE0337899.1 PD-(D/E)XK nuclease family protein [Caldilineaceae bacterium]